MMPGRKNTTARERISAPRRERKKAETRKRIFESSIQLFRTKGYDHVTIDRITERADVAKGTFFNYFPSKLHVLVAYWTDVAEELLRYGEAHRRGSARSFFKRLYGHLETQVQADRDIFAILIREIVLQPELQVQNATLTKQGFALYREVFDAGVTAGEIRDSIDFDVISALIEDAWIGTLRSWVFSGYAFRLRSRFEKKLDLLFDGVCAIAGARPSKPRPRGR